MERAVIDVKTTGDKPRINAEVWESTRRSEPEPKVNYTLTAVTNISVIYSVKTHNSIC